jgi:hypothetical protein
MLDKGKLGGGLFSKQLLNIGSEEGIKKAYLKLIWDNVFTIVNSINNKSAWNIISIGSDYDGAINHLHNYDSSEKMHLLFNDLLNFLKETNYQKKLWFGYEPRQLMTKIFAGNATAFVQNNWIDRKAVLAA